MSIRFVGWKGFWHSLVYPKAMLLPFKILDYLIKPMSLSLRLFGNIFGAFILMEFIYLIIPAILPGVDRPLVRPGRRHPAGRDFHLPDQSPTSAKSSKAHTWRRAAG